MNLLRFIFGKKHGELKIVLATLAVLLLLPTMTVVVMAASGISVVSSALTAVNPVTKVVEIFDPNGNKVTEVTITSNWPSRGYVSDEFGTFDLFRKHLRLGPHTGVDIANNFGRSGDPVTTFAEGVVTQIDTVDDSACGLFVRVDHGNNIQSIYCHLSSVEAQLLTKVKPGDIIGRMGSTGASTGAHLHFQINVYGIPVNPRNFVEGEPEPSQR